YPKVIHTLPLHDALPISQMREPSARQVQMRAIRMIDRRQHASLRKRRDHVDGLAGTPRHRDTLQRFAFPQRQSGELTGSAHVMQAPRATVVIECSYRASAVGGDILDQANGHDSRRSSCDLLRSFTPANRASGGPDNSDNTRAPLRQATPPAFPALPSVRPLSPAAQASRRPLDRPLRVSPNTQTFA